MQGKIVFVLKGMQPSCSSSITFSLSLSLIRFNHTRSAFSLLAAVPEPREVYLRLPVPSRFYVRQA